MINQKPLYLRLHFILNYIQKNGKINFENFIEYYIENVIFSK